MSSHFAADGRLYSGSADTTVLAWDVFPRPAKAGSIRERDSVACWLYGVARRLCMKARGRMARQARCVRTEGTGHGADPLAAAAAQEVCRIVDKELGRLPERNRAALVLCELQGLTQDEAARRLGCPLGTLRSRLERGRELLRRGLRQRGLTAPAALGGLLLAADSGKSAVPEALVAASLASARGPLGGVAVTSLRVEMLVRTALRMTSPARWAVRVGVLALGTLAVAAGIALFTAGNNTRSTPDEPPEPLAALALQDKPAGTPPAAKAGAQDEPGQKGKNAPPKLLHTLKPNSNGVCPLAFTPNGKLLAAGGGYNVVRLFDVATGQEQRQLKGSDDKNGWVNSIDFDKNGRLLASVGDDETIVIHEVATGKTVHEWSLPKGTVLDGVRFSPDGKTLAVAARQIGLTPSTLYLVDANTGKVLHKVPNSTDGSFMHVAACAPDGKIVAIPGPKLILAEVATGKKERELELLDKHGRAGNGFAAAFSPDGKRVAVGGGFYPFFPLQRPSVPTPVVAVWDWPAGKQKRLWQWKASGSVNRVAFFGDNRTLASAGPDQFRLWDVIEGKQVFAFPAKGGTWCTLAVSRQGLLAFANGHNEIQIWQVRQKADE